MDATLDSDGFKKPNFPLEKQPSKVIVEKEIKDETAEVIPEEVHVEVEPQLSVAKPSAIKTPTQPIPYSEPSWGGQPDIFYSLEVNFTLFFFDCDL